MENKIYRNQVNGMLYKLFNGWLMVKDYQGSSASRVWSVSQASTDNKEENEKNLAQWVKDGNFVEVEN